MKAIKRRLFKVPLLVCRTREANHKAYVADSGLGIYTSGRTLKEAWANLERDYRPSDPRPIMGQRRLKEFEVQWDQESEVQLSHALAGEP
jgi:hypothetical protein